MFCHQCAKELPQGAGFCPYCGAKAAQTSQAGFYTNPVESHFYPGAFMPAGVSEKEVGDTKSLGLAALIGGIFIPLIGFICGGIGLSKIKKLNAAATPLQKEQLGKSKKLCVAGIIVPAILMMISIVLSVLWGGYITKKIVNDYRDNNSSFFDDGAGNPNNFDEFFGENGEYYDFYNGYGNEPFSDENT